MNMKGTAFLARKKLIIDKFGQPAWDGFLQSLLSDAPIFAKPVMASTSIPIEQFLKFQEALVKTFFKGNVKAYWEMGAASAQWSLTDGPYRAFLDKRDLKALIDALPSIWSNYYDRGRIEVALVDKVLHMRLHDIPVWHVSFELMVMGYFHRALEMFSRRKVAWRCVSGGAPNVPIHYELYV
jgi:hypothetical protein